MLLTSGLACVALAGSNSVLTRKTRKKKKFKKTTNSFYNRPSRELMSQGERLPAKLVHQTEGYAGSLVTGVEAKERKPPWEPVPG